MIIKNVLNLSSKKWSGGTTKELFRDKENFSIRISCAEIYPGESDFSDFTGYKRILKILENNVTLIRNNQYIYLNNLNIFKFDGDDIIKSKNSQKVLDFNVIYKDDKLISLLEVEEKIFFKTEDKALIFSKQNKNNYYINDIKFNMNKYDFMLLSKGQDLILDGTFIIVSFKE
ncbi:HutD family protein (plasmid) [Cetobacterium somerae]|uniref:HutD family protein n=1 Tax=Cetobacterium somerae TaxID=188913 RepID=UPI003D7675AE